MEVSHAIAGHRIQKGRKVGMKNTYFCTRYPEVTFSLVLVDNLTEIIYYFFKHLQLLVLNLGHTLFLLFLSEK